MYEIFEQLLKEHHVTPYRISKETGIATATLSDWKNGKSTPKQDKLQKIADYFGVTIDYLMSGRKTETPEQTLSRRDERDIAKRLEQTLSDLENRQDTLLFNGEALDEDTKELLKISLENSIRIAKTRAKQKFTPKKYKKPSDSQ